MRRLFSAVLIGMVFGAVLMNLYLRQRLDELYISREKLKVELYETTERLKILESQDQQKQNVIRAIDVQFIKENGDLLTELALQTAVLELTQNLIGEEIEKVHHLLVIHLLDRRLIEIEGKLYRLQVKTLIIAPKMTFVLNYAAELEANEDQS